MRRRDFVAARPPSAAAWPLLRLAWRNRVRYPNRPIRMVVPYAPGGGVDGIARLVAQRLGERFGVPVVVENRAGGSGTIGGQAVQQAAPDGYTVLFAASTHVMARQVLRRAPYDPIADFAPVALVGQVPLMLVMSPARPQSDITGIVADARRKPDDWTFAVSALGAAGHLATILFLKLGGLDLVIAPYRGTGPALTDVAAGTVQLLLDPVVALLPLAQSGGVKGIAVTSASRSALAPSIPTAAEAGMPGLEFTSWYGIWGPKALPAPIVDRLNEALAEILARSPPRANAPPRSGSSPPMPDRTSSGASSRRDVARNGDLLRSVNFQPE